MLGWEHRIFQLKTTNRIGNARESSTPSRRGKDIMGNFHTKGEGARVHCRQRDQFATSTATKYSLSSLPIAGCSNSTQGMTVCLSDWPSSAESDSAGRSKIYGTQKRYACARGDEQETDNGKCAPERLAKRRKLPVVREDFVAGCKDQ